MELKELGTLSLKYEHMTGTSLYSELGNLDQLTVCATVSDKFSFNE